MASSTAGSNGSSNDKEKETASSSASESPGAVQMILYSLYFVAIFQGFYYAVLMAYGE